MITSISAPAGTESTTSGAGEHPRIIRISAPVGDVESWEEILEYWRKLLNHSGK
jgi:hypothetical protein